VDAWRTARAVALDTPDTRNRYADLLRALSIGVVVVGHWLMAAPTVESGVRFTLSDLLRVAPWTQWLTWAFQVMPTFFVVGGYANAASWEAARADGRGYGAWLSGRLQRLARPVLPFVLLWCALGLSALWFGLGREVVRSGSRSAFVPTWFLAVYVLVVAVAPAMYTAWRRFGWASFWALVLAAALVDFTARASGADGVRWANYVFVWLAIHQLGYAWRDGAFSEPARALSFALGGLAGLVVLVGLAAYPVSMVTVPGGDANSTPPTLALLALGMAHTGLLLAAEGRVAHALDGTSLWVATVLVNGVIMTLYLWHATVMILLVGIAELPGGFGLTFVPNSALWWLTRPAWILSLSVALMVFVAVFGRVEAWAPKQKKMAAAWRGVVAAAALCIGLVGLAAGGIGSDGAFGIQVAPVLMTLVGILLVTGLPWLPSRVPRDERA